ncbi:alpha/beta fold hydrolase [Sulfurimonas sp. HSL3-7]|uniref:alpha/beta fold hydrolase n=1 Tax=Sulfonitrofixus jiaomeiensis TaxID=3131938 RepID=UPI0031F7466A
MIDLVYNSTSFMLKVIDAILKTNIRLHGEEHLKKNAPTLFVANHFTRFETLIMPYVIDARSNRKIRSLADRSLFIGLLGTYLKHSGALSTADADRNDIIIGDLMCGRNNWIIYPEGFMLKNKKVTMNEGEFFTDIPRHRGAVFSGAALMALEAEDRKKSFKAAQKEQDHTKLDFLRAKFFFGCNEESVYQSTHITPVNITYYPLRPGHNALMNLAGLLAGEDASQQTLEEIEIEGNLLNSAEIHVRFCTPIDISHYTLDFDLSDKDVAKRLRHRLTTDFMEVIYQNVLVTIDHLFSVILEKHTQAIVTKEYLKQLLYLLASKIHDAGIYHCHESISEPLLHLFSDEGYAPYEDILFLALRQNILKEAGADSYQINHRLYRDDSDFHRVRLTNTLRVIYNEVALLKDLHQSTDEVLALKPQRLALDVFYTIFRRDLAIYHEDYKQFYSVMYSKAKEVGEPFVLYDETFTAGIVFAHGLKSTPSEIRDISEYLHQRGYNVYGVRLKGHGTLAQDLRDVKYTEWLESFNRGYAAMRQVCKKIYLGGFSTGGLVALLSAAKKQYPVEGIICINSALELRDIRVNYVVPTLHAVNDFLSLFNADVNYIEHESDYPEINYSRLYISTLAQLRSLMLETKKALSQIDAPLLVIQGEYDPIVDPKSAQVLMNSIASKHKELYMPLRNTHVIIKGEGSEEIFKRVVVFINKRENHAS